jgi:hypothetical protein
LVLQRPQKNCCLGEREHGSEVGAGARARGAKRQSEAHSAKGTRVWNGAGPDAYDSICKQSREWPRLTEEERKKRGTPKVTDAHGVTWVLLVSGSSGMLVEPKSIPAGHPLFGKPAVLKIFKRALSADTEPKESVTEEFETMSLPALARYVPEPYGLVLVGDVPVGYSMQKYKKSLEKHVQKRGLDGAMERRVCAVIEGVCAVVSCLDIKPANFVVSGDDVRMIDFGSIYCHPRGERSPEQIAADVAMCTLLFCLAACRGGDSDLTPLTPLQLPFLTSKLLDPENENKPRESVVAALSSINTADGTVYRRAITNVQGACYKKVAPKRYRGGDALTAVDLLTMLSDYKVRTAKSAAFGARREPGCAIL